MSDHPREIALPVRLGPGLEALTHEVIGACNDIRKFVLWSEEWLVRGSQVYRAQFALPPAVAKSERVTGLDAVVVTVSLTGEDQGQVCLRLSDELDRVDDAFREFVDRLASRLEHAGFC